MPYTFDYLDARDPANPANRAANASVTIHAVGDATKTPLTITTTDGTPLPNPITVGADGYGPAFMHATLDRVAWSGGGYTNFMTAYEGIKNEAIAARTAADTAAAEAAVSASLVNAPADTTMQGLINNTASATRGALNATYAPKWQASTAYAAGAPVLAPTGDVVTAKAAFTSGATFDPVNWNFPFGARNRNVVLALGTSITEGGHAGGAPNRWTDKLPAALAALLPGVTTTVVNAGVSGNTSAAMLTRLPALLDANPGVGVVVLETSVNDFKTTDGLTITQSEANMRSMIARCELAGARVIIANSAPFTIATGFSWSKQIEGNNMAARVATERGIPLVDLFNPLTEQPTYLSGDGLHPNAAGQQAWADNIAKVLAALQSGAQAEPLFGNLIIDRFTRSDTANGLGTTPTGHAWTTPLGTWGIADGKAYESAGTNQAFALVNTGTLTNQVVSAVVSTQDGSGLVARSDSTGANFYMLNVAAGAIYKKVAGSYTAIGPATGAFANGDTVNLEVSGSTITVKKNGTTVATTTDSAITTGTYAGLWRSGSNNGRWDKFTVN